MSLTKSEDKFKEYRESMYSSSRKVNQDRFYETENGTFMGIDMSRWYDQSCTVEVEVEVADSVMTVIRCGGGK